MSCNPNSTLFNFGVGKVPALGLIPIQQLNRAVLCTISAPPNILVAIVILRSRQLWSTRHIFWLAVTFFNSLVVIQSSFELIIFYQYQNKDDSHLMLCKIYSTFLGCPYNLLLAGLTLASCDRYLALAHTEFHQKYATPRNIGRILFGTFISIIGGQTFPFWTGLLPIECGIHYGWILATHCFQGTLSAICLVVQDRLFAFIRSYVHYTAPVTTGIVSDFGTQPLPRPNVIVGGTMRQVCRLELRAAKILGMGIVPFCVAKLVLSIVSVALLVSRYCQINTFWLYKSMLMSREVLLVHLAYIPVIFTAQSREFRVAIGRFCRYRQPPLTDTDDEFT